MVNSEEQDILTRISQIAGLINRHKSGLQSSEPHTDPQPQSSNHPPGASSWRQPVRGFYRGGRGHSRGGRVPQVHRNRTLILNNARPHTAGTESPQAESNDETPSSASGPAWITKSDRHLQLINSAIFDKQSQQRTKAIEETRKLKLRQRDERERTRLKKHLERLSDSTGAVMAGSPKAAMEHEISVQGLRFRVAKKGSKLVRVSGDHDVRSTPKTAKVGGVMFYRSKNGNLYRSGIVRAHRSRGVVKKINEPCRAFSTTGTCLKGPKCRFIHDPSRVAVCRNFLQKGICEAGDSCDLSHDLTPERTPACLHFSKGNCSNASCRYTHVRVSPNALVCRAFGIYGYCEKGLQCPDRHVHECPDFSNTGTCNTKGCKLLHRYKASVIRKNPTLAERVDGAEDSDLSSDEEHDEIDSDDVDSDEMDEEFLGEDSTEQDSDIPNQQDFVQLPR